MQEGWSFLVEVSEMLTDKCNERKGLKHFMSKETSIALLPTRHLWLVNASGTLKSLQHIKTNIPLSWKLFSSSTFNIVYLQITIEEVTHRYED